MTTRRTVLGSLCGGATAGLSGCAGLPGFGDASSGTERPFSDWLYAPSITGVEHYSAMSIDPATVAAVRASVQPETYAAWTDPVDATNPARLSADRIDRHVRFDGGTVALMGSFSRSEVLQGLVDNGYTERTTHEGFQVYVRSVASNGSIEWEAAGATDGAYVATRRGTRFGALLVLREAIDAGVGRNPRYVTENQTFGLLVDHLLTGTVVTVETFDDLVGSQTLSVPLGGLAGAGHGLVVDAPSTRRRVVLVYRDEEIADAAAVRSWVREGTPVGADTPTSDVELEREGRAFVLSWQQPLRSVADPLAVSVAEVSSGRGWFRGRIGRSPVRGGEHR